MKNKKGTLSIELGSFPSAFKLSIVTPIYKSGDKQNVTNNRPITIITSLTKVMEKITMKSLSNDLTKYDHKSQWFSPHKSTQDAINVFTNNAIYFENIDEGTPTIGAFIDLIQYF